ncbi:MAG: ATP-binding domain-containing protein [Polyangiaceae bacterium]|nr:ATP-binding domain-containing protein [Polyangiaceae bacterium]
MLERGYPVSAGLLTCIEMLRDLIALHLAEEDRTAAWSKAQTDAANATRTRLIELRSQLALIGKAAGLPGALFSLETRKTTRLNMFNKALSMFVRAALPGLHRERAVLDTFHGWALDRVKRAYRGELRIDTSDLPGKQRAVALKKTLGVLRAVEAFAEAQPQRLQPWLEQKLAPYKSTKWLEGYAASKLPVARRLIALRSQALAARHDAKGVQRERLIQVHAVFVQALQRVTQYKEELARILTDRKLLADHVTASAADIDALVTYQRALAGKEGTDRRPGPFVAFEDLALLLRLIQLKHGGLPGEDEAARPDVYDHLVIDEAQDFGAVELTVLLASVRSRTGVTLAGDLNQKIIPEADFIGWDALAHQLGMDGANVSKLEVAHRSTIAIMRVADSIVGEQTLKGRPGPIPTLTVTDSQDGQLDVATDLVQAALKDRPQAHVCVVVRHAGAAKSVHAELSSRLAGIGAAIRLGHNNEFEFAPGVTVTNMRQVKGLEFDAVIALDATTANYPDNEHGRRYLYTLVTRAKNRLDIVSVGEPAVLLKAAVDAGLIEVIERMTVEPVVFTAEDEEPI